MYLQLSNLAFVRNFYFLNTILSNHFQFIFLFFPWVILIIPFHILWRMGLKFNAYDFSFGVTLMVLPLPLFTAWHLLCHNLGSLNSCCPLRNVISSLRVISWASPLYTMEQHRGSYFANISLVLVNQQFSLLTQPLWGTPWILRRLVIVDITVCRQC